MLPCQQKNWLGKTDSALTRLVSKWLTQQKLTRQKRTWLSKKTDSAKRALSSKTLTQAKRLVYVYSTFPLWLSVTRSSATAAVNVHVNKLSTMINDRSKYVVDSKNNYVQSGSGTKPRLLSNKPIRPRWGHWLQSGAKPIFNYYCSWFMSHNVSRWLPLRMRTRPLRMSRITWPLSRGSKTITFLESPTLVCLFTMQLRCLYDESRPN